jgi:hypothetical protein
MVVSRITECLSENGHGFIDWITECVLGITVNSLSNDDGQPNGFPLLFSTRKVSLCIIPTGISFPMI